MKTRFVATAALALVLATQIQGAQADTLIDEGFDDVSTLADKGWVLENRSSPLGPVPGWFQGQDYIFPALNGDPTSYASSNYNAGVQGGSIADWLITSQFSTKYDGTVSFWVRSDPNVGYLDFFSYGLSTGGSSTEDFTLTKAAAVPYAWTQVTFSYTGTGQDTFGRLAIVHVGLADIANDMGVDNVLITAVPEPSAPLLLGFGLLTLSLLLRRPQAR